MRLWHKDLIPVLPRQQLLGQWRELCAIMANIAKIGTANHVLVNEVMHYPCTHLYVYASYVCDTMHDRGYHCDFSKFGKSFVSVFGDDNPFFLSVNDLFPGWMNERYLTQNYYNLQEKYDCGAITDDEWVKIEERYRELIG